MPSDLVFKPAATSGIPRRAWPHGTPTPGSGAAMPSRASRRAWRATTLTIGLPASGRRADTHPWRHNDQLARARMRVRVRTTLALSTSLLVISATSRALSGYFHRLETDLASERSRIAVLSDSVAEYRVALNGRAEQMVTLVRSRASVRLPIPGPVASGFSIQRLHPILGLWRSHEGIDIPSRLGTPIRPVAPGRIVRVGRDLGYGLVIDVDHGLVTTRYAHLSRATMREGDWVKPGDAIGLVGESGLATAPHLHYEVLRGRTPVDPLSYSLRVIELVPSTTRRVADTPDEPAPPPPRSRPARYPAPTVVSTSSSSSEL